MQNLEMVSQDSTSAVRPGVMISILMNDDASDFDLCACDAYVQVDVSNWNADQMKRFWEFVHAN